MYTPLDLKTEYSLLSSMIKIDDLISFALSNKITSLSITDNNMYGVMSFYHKCISNNIKPIVGLEVNIDNINFILYCTNNIGYKNLLKISTMLSDKTISFDNIKNYNSNLICIIPFKYKDNYSKLKDVYENIFIGYSTKEEMNVLDNNRVYLKEILYLNKNDYEYYKYLLGIRDGIILEKVISSEDNYLYLKEDLKEFDLTNNYKITQMCNLKIDFNLDLLPIYNCPNNKDSYSYLKQLCIEGLKKQFGDTVSKKYADRLKYELDVINKMGFCNYFLIVYDYVNYSRNNGILVGPGRGSAAGSLVSFCLGITKVDPLKYNLLFERFLNPERISMPDIDIDFEYDRREEVVEYCRNKYGKKRVAPIITFGSLGSKQVIRDVARVMDLDLEKVDRLAKLIDSDINLKQNYNNKKISDLLKNNKDLFNLYRISTKLEGLKRHKTIHAAGIVMSKIDLDEVIPLDYHDQGFYLTGYSMEYLEEIGLLKMDFLAIKNLTTITSIIKNINENLKINLDFDSIPLDDKDTYKIFANGYTSGIFQFESNGMKNFLKKFSPSCFDDIVASMALYRPGPMNNIDIYINRKNNKEVPNYFHKDLEPILKPTYGIIVYQEQIMQIACTLAGFSLGEADILRKAMSKKKVDTLLNLEKKFIEQSVNRGYNESLVKKIYDYILKFAEYGFNKSHSVSYSIIAYKMAYLKTHYPQFFMKSILDGSISSDTKTREYIYECKMIGLNIVNPDINISTNQYIIKNNNIIFPLCSIKNIGTIISNQIILEREKNKFRDIFDFIVRTYNKNINKKVIQILNYAGCFNNFNINKKTLDNNLDVLINYAEIGQELDESLRPMIEEYEEYSSTELMQKELEVFGFYLSKHPVTEYKIKYNTVDLINVNNFFDKYINVVILVDSLRKINTKAKEEMCFITGSDEITSIDIILFPKKYSEYNFIKEKDILKINGKVEKRFDKYQIIVNSLEKIED